MSQYLQFKKNNVELCSFCRSTELYSAFDDYSEEWKELTQQNIINCNSNLREKIENYKSQIDKYTKIFNNCRTSEDMYDVMNTIEEYEFDLDQVKAASGQLDTILFIFEECGENDKMYWRIS